jgi:hypothetical protein
MRDAVDFLRDPPLDPAVKLAYQVLTSAAIATIPPRVRRVQGLKPRPGALGVGRAAMLGMRSGRRTRRRGALQAEAAVRDTVIHAIAAERVMGTYRVR